MNTIPALIVAAGYTVALLWISWNLIKLRQKLDKAEIDLIVERRRRMEAEEVLARTELRVVDFAAKMSPLIAKSDWMTGRWGGQFDTLVRLENQRNADVDTARKALYEIPMVKRNPINPTVYTPKDADK